MTRSYLATTILTPYSKSKPQEYLFCLRNQDTRKRRTYHLPFVSLLTERMQGSANPLHTDGNIAPGRIEPSYPTQVHVEKEKATSIHFSDSRSGDLKLHQCYYNETRYSSHSRPHPLRPYCRSGRRHQRPHPSRCRNESLWGQGRPGHYLQNHWRKLRELPVGPGHSI